MSSAVSHRSSLMARYLWQKKKEIELTIALDMETVATAGKGVEVVTEKMTVAKAAAAMVVSAASVVVSVDCVGS